MDSTPPEIQQASIDILFDEILIQIFSYLSAEVVVTTVRQTCNRWRALSYDNEVWRKVFFVPPIDWTDMIVLNFMYENPQLENVIFKHRRNYEHILKVMCQSIGRLRRIVIINKTGPNLESIMRLIKLFPQIESFEAILGSDSMLYDVAKLFGERQKPLRYTIVYNCVTQLLLWVMVGMKKNIIQSLAFTCKITSAAIEVISACSQLKHLCIFNEDVRAENVDMSPLSKLTRLKTLQLVGFPDANEMPLAHFHDVVFYNLVRLEICEGGRMLEELVDTFLLKSPNIRHLNLHGNQLTDHKVQNISLCKQLEYLDISYNFHLTMDFISCVALNCPKLRFLDISCCKSITDGVINTLANCRNLESLTIEGFYYSGNLFRYIPFLFPNLSEFHVRHFRDYNLLCYLTAKALKLDVTFCSNPFEECALPH